MLPVGNAITRQMDLLTANQLMEAMFPVCMVPLSYKAGNNRLKQSVGGIICLFPISGLRPLY